MNKQADLSRARNKLDDLEALSNKDLLERAHNEISALCGAEGKPKQWTMSIPVDADRDSDVLFGEVLIRFRKLDAVVELVPHTHNPANCEVERKARATTHFDSHGPEPCQMCDALADLEAGDAGKQKD
jgi:hypothetical protein